MCRYHMTVGEVAVQMELYVALAMPISRST
jgi:hypothetical protein